MIAPLVATIDRDPRFLDLMNEVLRDEGYCSVQATTSAEGLALVIRTRPDLVMVDLWLEMRDAGKKLIENIRGDYRIASSPILVCSADYAATNIHARWLERQFCAVLPKPFELDSLLEHVRALISTPDAAVATHIHGAIQEFRVS
jgi:DNA-binding response OmpR family regulator